MLALLSSFLTPSPRDADHNVRRLVDFGLPGYGLSHYLCETEIRAFAAAFRATGSQLTLLRSNIVVTEDDLERLPRRPSLSSLDPDERRAAVEETERHVEWAQELECPALLIDSGRVPVSWPRDQWHRLFEEGRWRHGGRWVDGAAEHEEKLFAKLRAEAAPNAVDAFLSSLDTLLDGAESRGVRLVIQNPRRADSVGNPEELERVFDEFHGAPIASWFDVGNCDYQEQLGLLDGRRLRTTLEPHLAGITVTDAVGLSDGLPTGDGMILLPIALTPLFDRDRDPVENPPLVVRCARETSDARIENAIEKLRSDGFDGPPPVEAHPFPIIGG